MRKNQILIWIVILVAVLGVVATIILLQRSAPLTESEQLGPETAWAAAPVQSDEENIAAELYPMTIPYLREREYVSQLTDLVWLRSAGNYDVYQASYDSDGFKINGLLTIPQGERPSQGWPAVVFVHGYQNPTTYETDGRSYSDYWAYLANQGLMVFKIDLRGHGDSQGTPSGAYFSSDYVVDTLNAYSALAASELVDSQQISLWGHSMAGNVLLRAVAARTEIPKAVIWGGAVYTYADMRAYGIQDSSFVPSAHREATDVNARPSQIRNLFTGETDWTDPFWTAMIPTNYLAEIQTKIGLFHAQDDEVVSIEYSRNLVAVAAETTAQIELFEYQTGGHNLSAPSFSLAMSETADFLLN